MAHMKKYIFVICIYYISTFTFKFVSNKSVANLRVYFLDVGQGDAIYIDYKNGPKILIDAGPGDEIERYLPDLFSFPNCSFDLVIITHLHQDHLEGILPILDKCKSGMFWINDVHQTTNLYKRFHEKIALKKNLNMQLSNVFTNKKFTYGNLTLISLWPTENFYKNFNPDTDNLNDISTVTLLDYNGFDMLLTGDVSYSILNRLNYSDFLPTTKHGIDVLNVPHHGSVTGLNKTTMLLLQPKTCVISVGINGYKLPSSATLLLLKTNLCALKRTDSDGTIEFDIN